MSSLLDPPHVPIEERQTRFAEAARVIFNAHAPRPVSLATCMDEMNRARVFELDEVEFAHWADDYFNQRATNFDINSDSILKG